MRGAVMIGDCRYSLQTRPRNNPNTECLKKVGRYAGGLRSLKPVLIWPDLADSEGVQNKDECWTRGRDNLGDNISNVGIDSLAK